MYSRRSTQSGVLTMRVPLHLAPFHFTAVMRRLGLHHEPDRDFDHPRVPDTHPHLKRHVLYTISRQQWERRIG